MARETIDLRGLKCPLPALFARRALERAGSGETIEIVTDDPLAPIDIPHMCRQEGFDLVALTRDGDCARMLLRRPIAEAPAAGPDDPERPAP